MVVCYCPACGQKILLKEALPEQKELEFRHCGHHILIKPEVTSKKKKK